MKKIDSETKLGFVFSGIAIVAVIVEMILGKFSTEAIVGGIKDISGSIVAVFVLITAWIAMHPSKNKNFDFDKILDNSLEEWQKNHKNMISTKGNVRDLYMHTDIANFFEKGNNDTGRFVKVEATDKIVLTFSLNRGLVVGHGIADEVAKDNIKKAGEMITRYCNSNFSDIAESQYSPSKTNIVVTWNESTKTQQDIDALINMLDIVYQAFLVCASVNA